MLFISSKFQFVEGQKLSTHFTDSKDCLHVDPGGCLLIRKATILCMLHVIKMKRR